MKVRRIDRQLLESNLVSDRTTSVAPNDGPFTQKERMLYLEDSNFLCKSSFIFAWRILRQHNVTGRQLSAEAITTGNFSLKTANIQTVSAYMISTIVLFSSV